MLRCRPFLILMTLILAGLAGVAAAERERVPLQNDWRFTRHDPSGVGSTLDYDQIRAWVLPSSAAFVKDPSLLPPRPDGNLGEGISFIRPEFDDRTWRVLDLPHDWAIEGPFRQELPGETAKLAYDGPVWYRKRFTIPTRDQGRRFYLDIDGAMSHATVWCNGQFVGGWPSGYASFRLDLTPHAKPGSENVLAIRLNSPPGSARWYPGAGLYRHVWLVTTNQIHVGHWGTHVTTPAVSAEQATVDVRVAVANHGPAAQAVVKTSLYAGDTEVAVVPAQTLAIPARGSAEAQAQAVVAQPRRWSPTSPDLYRAVTTVEVAGVVVDRYETSFGIRSITFTASDGFLLNGERLRIQGVCNHHDLGALGAAWNTRAAERQLEILKAMGTNALRTSHNIPAPELLALCDRMGILVMDESFDCWRKGKSPNDYGRLFDDWHEQDLRAMVRRDRNHPSVFLWSIGNEVLELGDPEQGPAIAARLTAIVREEDQTRPTVIGSNNPKASYNGVQKAVGVMGQNYQAGGYTKFKHEHPDIPLIGSETSSCFSSRGEYFFQTEEQWLAGNAASAAEAARRGRPAPNPAPFGVVSSDKLQGRSNFQVSSYDLYTTFWGWVPDAEFAAQARNPHVMGEFVWTGFDYLGEPTPYNRDQTNLLNFHDAESRARAERELSELGRIKPPSRSSYFGIVDLAGFPKDRFYLYQAHWRPDLPMVHLLPHWNWPERVGQVVPVHVYTSGDAAELFLNGVSQGRRVKGPEEYRLRWDTVVYAPGELKVVASKNGKPWAERTVRTAGAPAQVLATADRSTITADRTDLSFITVTIADASGTLVPRSKNVVTFRVAGPGELVATDNGDATSHASFQSPQIKAFNGLALGIVRATGPGPITVTATAEGLTGATVVITGSERR